MSTTVLHSMVSWTQGHTLEECIRTSHSINNSVSWVGVLLDIVACELGRQDRCDDVKYHSHTIM